MGEWRIIITKVFAFNVYIALGASFVGETDFYTHTVPAQSPDPDLHSLSQSRDSLVKMEVILHCFY